MSEKEKYNKETWKPEKSDANHGKKYAPIIDQMIQGFLEGITEEDMAYIHERKIEAYKKKLYVVIRDFTNDVIAKSLDLHYSYVKSTMEKDQLLDKLNSVGITVKLDVSEEDVENEVMKQVKAYGNK